MPPITADSLEKSAVLLKTYGHSVAHVAGRPDADSLENAWHTQIGSHRVTRG